METTIEATGTEKPMGYQEFKEELMRRVQERLEDGMKAELAVISKNNDTRCEELTCRSRDSNMNPAMRAGELYERYCALGMEWCVEEAVRILGYRRYVDTEQMWGSWDSAKGKVAPKLVSQKWNRKRLAKLPHKTVLDLAVIFQYRYGTPDGEEGLLTVTEELMNQWGIHLEELYDAAYDNLQNEGCRVTEVMQELREAFGEGVEETGGQGVFILSNQRKREGAAAVLCTGLLQEFAERQGSDFFLLPSSVHEWVLFPDRGEIPVSALREMVKEINQAEVEREEWLSDEVYHFSRSTGEVRLL